MIGSEGLTLHPKRLDMKMQFIQFNRAPQPPTGEGGPSQLPEGTGNAQTSGANEQKQASSTAPATSKNLPRTGFESSWSTGSGEKSAKEAVKTTLDRQKGQAE
jgi:hypothetical protein